MTELGWKPDENFDSGIVKTVGLVLEKSVRRGNVCYDTDIVSMPFILKHGRKSRRADFAATAGRLLLSCAGGASGGFSSAMEAITTCFRANAGVMTPAEVPTGARVSIFMPWGQRIRNAWAKPWSACPHNGRPGAGAPGDGQFLRVGRTVVAAEAAVALQRVHVAAAFRASDEFRTVAQHGRRRRHCAVASTSGRFSSPQAAESEATSAGLSSRSPAGAASCGFSSGSCCSPSPEVSAAAGAAIRRPVSLRAVPLFECRSRGADLCLVVFLRGVFFRFPAWSGVEPFFPPQARAPFSASAAPECAAVSLGAPGWALLALAAARRGLPHFLAEPAGAASTFASPAVSLIGALRGVRFLRRRFVWRFLHPCGQMSGASDVGAASHGAGVSLSATGSGRGVVGGRGARFRERRAAALQRFGHEWSGQHVEQRGQQKGVFLSVRTAGRGNGARPARWFPDRRQRPPVRRRAPRRSARAGRRSGCPRGGRRFRRAVRVGASQHRANTAKPGSEHSVSRHAAPDIHRGAGKRRRAGRFGIPPRRGPAPRNTDDAGADRKRGKDRERWSWLSSTRDLVE